MPHLPPFNLGDFVMQQIKDHTQKIAIALNTVGLINVQFAIKNDVVYIIEANPRASRTVPFIAKAKQQPFVNYATKVMLGKHKVGDFDYTSHTWKDLQSNSPFSHSTSFQMSTKHLVQK